jgi:hypothetical protein
VPSEPLRPVLQVPIGVFDAIIGAIDFFANFFPKLKVRSPALLTLIG